MYLHVGADTFQFHFEHPVVWSDRMLDVVHRTGVDDTFSCQMFIIDIQSFQE